MNLSKLHRLTGTIIILIFLLTGVYMQFRFPMMYQGNEVIRYLYRANHVYLLTAGLVNIGVGVYLVLQSQPWRRRLQVIGSWLILLSPMLLLFAFFYEPSQASPQRPFTGLGIILLAIGTVLHLVGNWFKK